MSASRAEFPAIERAFAQLGRLACLLFAFALPVVLAELAARALHEPEPVRRVYDPFAYRIPQPGLVDTFESPFGGQVTVRLNERGMRGPSLTEQGEEGELRVVFLGGSATECYPLPREKTWPEIVGEQLRQASGKPVRVWNAGASAATSSVSLGRLQHQVLELQPHLVVVMDGINDLIGGFHPRFRPDGRHLPRPPTAGARPRSYLLAALRQALADDGKRPGSRALTAKAPPAEVPPTSADDITRFVSSQEGSLALKVFARNLRSMAALAEEHDFPILFLTQPTMYREEPHPGEAERFRLQHDLRRLGVLPPDVPALARGMAAMNAETLRLAAKTTAHGFDLAAELPQEATLIYDECHLTPEGSQRVGELVGRVVVELLPRKTAAAASAI